MTNFKWCAVVITALMLTGCGQYGPLYLPQNTAYSPLFGHAEFYDQNPLTASPIFAPVGTTPNQANETLPYYWLHPTHPLFGHTPQDTSTHTPKQAPPIITPHTQTHPSPDTTEQRSTQQLNSTIPTPKTSTGS